MRNWKLITAVFFVTSGLLAQNKALLYKISGKVTQTSSYCGGAAPTQEMLEAYNTPSRYIGKVLYVRKGKTNSLSQPIVLKFVSDSAGNFSFKLPPGDYCIIQKEQVKKLNYKKFPNTNELSSDKMCLSDWWNKPLMILEIKDSGKNDLNFNFFHPCFVPGDIPCITYNGPMPP